MSLELLYFLGAAAQRLASPLLFKGLSLVYSPTWAMRRDREYIGLASILLQLVAAPTVLSGLGSQTDGLLTGCVSRKVVVGKITQSHDWFFLVEEGRREAYMLTSGRLVQAFVGKKVRVFGTFESPHVLAVERLQEIL